MTGIVIAVLFLIAATRSSKTAPDEKPLVSSVRSGARLDGSSASGAVRYLTSRERCRSARRGVTWYRGRARDWLKLRGVGLDLGRTNDPHKSGGLAVPRSPSPRKPRSVPSRVGRKPHGCADARYLASVARERASIARRGYERWLERRTLRDFEVRADSNAWLRAVREAQRAFPGTEAWLVSCSAAEGGHGRWVRYGGGSYYPGYEHTDAVGNWMQFRWSTFKGMYRRALEDLSSKNFRVPPMLREPGDVRAWLSPLATALAAGWARWSDNDDSHWSASFGRGCS